MNVTQCYECGKELTGEEGSFNTGAGHWYCGGCGPKCEKCKKVMTEGWLCQDNNPCNFCEDCSPKCKKCKEPVDEEGDAIVDVSNGWSSCENEPCSRCEEECDECGRVFCGGGC